MSTETIVDFPYSNLQAEVAPLERATTIVTVADGAEPDNAAALEALARLADRFGLDYLAVIAGRPHSDTPDAPLAARDLSPGDLEESRRLHYIGATQIKALLARSGHPEARLYVGQSDIENTDLTATFSHGDHTHPRVYYDAFDFEGHMPNGDFKAFLSDLRSTTGGVILAMLGPLVDASKAMDALPELADRVVAMVGQGSYIDAEGTLHGKSFNVSAAPESAETVLDRLMQLGKFVIMISSKFTRHKDFSFADAAELLRAGIVPDVAELYQRHIDHVIIPRGYTQPGTNERLRIALHDMRVAQIIDWLVRISRGQVSAEETQPFTLGQVVTPDQPGKHLVVTGQEPGPYSDFLGRYYPRASQ